MEDLFNLNRFIEAQSLSYDTALNEIKRGKKTSHWMWYIFPQFKGLGYSSTSQIYSIMSVEEALLFFKHPILGNRLLEITNAFLNLENKSAYEILGSPDNLKMNSCMTLFNSIQTESDIFSKVLDKFYSNSQCAKTISQLNHS
jgi:uncharacterized protein (DUF1810 family)